MAAAGSNGRVVDFDARRKARAEITREPVVIKMGGKRYTLPPVLAAEFAICAQENNLRGALDALLGEHADAFLATKPSVDDLEDLFTAVSDLYGVTPGEG